MVSRIETPSLADLRVFARAARLLSLTAAANDLGLPKSAVSKALARLEKQLGVQLMERTSRRVALTPAGELLTLKTDSLLGEVDALKQALTEERDQPVGRVRLTAPVELGTHFVAGLAPLVRARYPDVRLAVSLGYEFEDMLEPSIDIALRVGEVHDDRLVSHVIGRFRRVLVASPEYLKQHPVRTVEDLAERDCLLFSDRETGTEWPLARGEVTERVAVSSALSVRSFTALMHAARAGLGIARVPDFAAAEWLRRGELVRVLPEWGSPPNTVYAVHRFGHQRIARVAAVLELLKEERDWLDRE